MPSRACTSLLRGKHLLHISCYDKVSMPSRACTSLLRKDDYVIRKLLKSVSMPSRACTSLLRGKHLLHISCYDKVSMPSRACTSLLQYPFKNLGFMRFLEPVFAGIYQNILTVAYFYAC